MVDVFSRGRVINRQTGYLAPSMAQNQKKQANEREKPYYENDVSV